MKQSQRLWWLHRAEGVVAERYLIRNALHSRRRVAAASNLTLVTWREIDLSWECPWTRGDVDKVNFSISERYIPGTLANVRCLSPDMFFLCLCVGYIRGGMDNSVVPPNRLGHTKCTQSIILFIVRCSVRIVIIPQPTLSHQYRFFRPHRFVSGLDATKVVTDKSVACTALKSFALVHETLTSLPFKRRCPTLAHWCCTVVITQKCWSFQRPAHGVFPCENAPSFSGFGFLASLSGRNITRYQCWRVLVRFRGDRWGGRNLWVATSWRIYSLPILS